MRTLTIDRKKLVDALMDLYHVATTDTRYAVAINLDPERGNVVPARVIRTDTPSSLPGYYFDNFVGEINYSPTTLLDPDNYYTWGEEGAGSGPDGEWTEADDEVAREWIEENLLDYVELDGERFAVKYI